MVNTYFSKHRITTFANASHMFDKVVTTSAIRKSVVTFIYPLANDEERKNLATLMCHQSSTQERSYNIAKRRNEGAAAVATLKTAATSTSMTTSTITEVNSDSPVKTQ